VRSLAVDRFDGDDVPDVAIGRLDGGLVVATGVPSSTGGVSGFVPLRIEARHPQARRERGHG